MENKKIILIENKSQAKEYLKNKGKFKDAVPITFDFPSEELLLNAHVKFKTEEEYETETIYKGIYDASLKNTKEICEKIKINYRGVELFQLFYVDLFNFLGISRRYLRLLEKIKKTEKPNEIITLRNRYNLNINEEICSKIAQGVFKEKLKEILYTGKNKEQNLIIKIVGFVQRIFSKIKFSFSKEKDNIIFFDDSKVRFELLIKELLKNENNKLFRCKDHLQKSFFVDRKYIPFYEFSQKKSSHQRRLLHDTKKFLENKNNLSFFNGLKIENNLIPLLKEWINYYLKFKFLEISGVINHMIQLMEKKKIDLIVVFADTETFGKTFVQVGKLFNIPSIVVQHGFLGEDLCIGFVPLSADYILIFGEGSKERLHNQEISEEQIIVTGSPQFDKYLNKKKITRKEKKIVVITDCDSSHNNAFPEIITKKRLKEFFRIMYRVMKKFPEYTLVVKGRKDWDMNNLPLMIARQENFNNVEFIINADPIKLLADVDMVIVNNTTMAFDALLLDKPVISIWFKDMERFRGYKDSKTIKTTYNQKQFEQAIKECQIQTKKDNLKRKKYLEGELYKLDGKSSERIVNFMDKLILEKNIDKLHKSF